MVVDANRDEALLCLQKAKDAMLAKDVGKMKRFIAKAKRLDPNCDVSAYLTGGAKTDNDSSGERPDRGGQERSYSHDDHYEDADLHKRRRHSRGSPSRNNTDATSTSSQQRNRSRSRSAGRAQAEFSEEDRITVERIRHCKDYYEILQVNKEVTEVTLKKRYRELALKLHPDKCKVPGSTDAFKALGNAYAVLSDSKKRAEYDQFGAEGAQGAAARRRYDGFDYDVGRGFEAEVSPEDIFEMFFGGGFPGGHVNRHRRPTFHYRHQEPQEGAPLLSNLFQVLPLIVVLFGGLLVQFLVGDPAFSLTHDGEYRYMRTTKDMGVPYYVKKNFDQEHGAGRIVQIEENVEKEYLNHLRMMCYREKSNRDTMIWTAKMRSDPNLRDRAQSMPLPSCRKLEELLVR